MKTSNGGGADLRWWLGVAAVTFMLPSLLGSAAQATPRYDTTRVVTQQGNACVGAKGCTVIASEPRQIKAGRSDVISARCPDARPYLVSWDARFHEHIALRQLKRWPHSLRVAATNQAGAPGQATLFIGCAKQRPASTVEVQSLGALPTKSLLPSPR
jgi:hypothetical protein